MAVDKKRATEQFLDFWEAEGDLEAMPLGEVRKLFKTAEFKDDPEEAFFLDVEGETQEFDDELGTARALVKVLTADPECDLPDSVADELGDEWNDDLSDHVVVFARKVFGWKPADEEDGEADEGDEPDEEDDSQDEEDVEDEDEENGSSEEVIPAAAPELVPLSAVLAAAPPAPATTPARQLRSLSELLPTAPPPATTAAGTTPPPPTEDDEEDPAVPDEYGTNGIKSAGYILARDMAADMIQNAPELLNAFSTRLGSTVGVMLYGYRECNAVLDYILERRTKTAAELEADYGKPGTPPMPVRVKKP